MDLVNTLPLVNPDDTYVILSETLKDKTFSLTYGKAFV
uniref:Uncharacterized protein n=1 Tax=Saccharolobus solfataricus (strain 98/2) TaxID=555311 RepID=D0KQB6_SACS9